MSSKPAKRSSKRRSGRSRDTGGSSEAKEPDDMWSQLLRKQEAAERDGGVAAAAVAAAATAKGADGAAAGAGGDEPPPETAASATEAAIAGSERGTESFVLFVGAKQSGKSSLVVQFLNPNKTDEPKPTVALEYTYGRRSNTASTVKDIAHLWELGGGSHLSELLSVPITKQRVPHAVVCVVVDMSKPGSAIDTLLKWLGMIGDRVRECTDKLAREDASRMEGLRSAARARANVKDDTLDARVVEPSLVPLLIVLSKYDQFEEIESARRKPLMMSLRYIAHVHGASLICVGKRDKTQLAHFRSMLNHYVFQTEAKKTTVVDPGRPLIIPAGADSLESIGAPAGATMPDITDGPLETRVAKFQRAVAVHFKPEPTEEEEDKRRDDEAGRWMEPTVDSMRAQKQEELDRYVKEAERKLRLEASKRPAHS